jgi:hypothetical protein
MACRTYPDFRHESSLGPISAMPRTLGVLVRPGACRPQLTSRRAADPEGFHRSRSAPEVVRKYSIAKGVLNNGTIHYW